MKRQIVAFLLAVSMTLSCCGCGHSSAVNQATMVLNQLERSFNSCDVDGVVNCFESDVQEVYNVILSLIDVMALDDLKSNGKKSKALIQLGAKLLYLTADMVTEDGLPPLKIIVNSAQKLNEERVRVNATFRYDYPQVDDDDALAVTKDLDIIKENGRWCIALVVDHSYDGTPQQENGGGLGTPNDALNPIEQPIENNGLAPLVPNQSQDTEKDELLQPPVVQEANAQETLDSSTDDSTDNQGLYEQIYSQIFSNREKVLLSGNYEVQEIETVIRQIQSEHPEFFWIGDYTINSGDPINIDFKVQNEYQDHELMTQKLNSAVETIVAGFPSEISDYDKILLAHDYIVKNTDYDTAGAVANGDGVWKTAYGCLIQHRAVSEGYAEAFQLIMQKLGFECGICHGTAKGNPHTWNYVKYQDDYYWVDVTWDDPSISSEGTANSNLRHSYFMMSDELLLRTRSLDSDNLVIPICNKMDSNYFVYHQYYLTDYSLESVSEIVGKSPERHMVELMFASSGAYDKAIQKLFDENEIWEIDAVKNSNEQLTYYNDDDMYVLTICY